MTKKEQEQYRQRLHDLGKELTSRSSSLAEEALRTTADDTRGNHSKAPMHLGDLSSTQYEQEISAELLTTERNILGEIAGALDRLDNGTFGRCENCQREIGRERLDALPYTSYCIECARALEQ
jgi:RNA polymerase-binding transcription factor DksA